MSEDETNQDEKTSWGRWALEWARDLGLLLVIVVAIGAWQTRGHLGTGEKAPPFALRTLAGERVTSTQLEGKPTAIVFWAPWCGVCKQETGAISAVRDAVGEDANVVSMALSYESRASVEGFVEDYGVDYPVLMGNDGTLSDYSIEAFPTIYVLDAEGRVSDTVVGYTTGWGLRMRLWWAGI